MPGKQDPDQLNGSGEDHEENAVTEKGVKDAGEKGSETIAPILRLFDRKHAVLLKDLFVEMVFHRV